MLEEKRPEEVYKFFFALFWEKPEEVKNEKSSEWIAFRSVQSVKASSSLKIFLRFSISYHQ